LSIKIKKIKSRQIVFKSVADLDKTNSKKFFAKFYNSAAKSFCNSKLSTKLSDKNIINFYFIFARISLTNISIKNKKHENIYKWREQVCNKNKKNYTN